MGGVIGAQVAGGLMRGVAEGYLLEREKQHRDRQARTATTLQTLGGLMESSQVRDEAKQGLADIYFRVLGAKNDKEMEKTLAEVGPAITGLSTAGKVDLPSQQDFGEWVKKLPGTAATGEPPPTMPGPSVRPPGIFMTMPERQAAEAGAAEKTAYARQRGSIQARTEAIKGGAGLPELGMRPVATAPKVVTRDVTADEVRRNFPTAVTPNGMPLPTNAQGMWDVMQSGESYIVVPAGGAAAARSWDVISQQGVTYGVRGPDGKKYYAGEQNIPEEGRKLLNAAQKAEQEKMSQVEAASARTLANAMALADKRDEVKRKTELRKIEDGARDSDRLYRTMNQELDRIRKQGYVTGPQSMAMISWHMSMTVGDVKRARVGKDIIMEHLHARSWPEELRATIQKVLKGGVITPQQAEEFVRLASEKRQTAWNIVRESAESRNLPTPKMPEDLYAPGAKTATMEDIRAYARTAGISEAEARKAFEGAGYVIQ